MISPAYCDEAFPSESGEVAPAESLGLMSRSTSKQGSSLERLSRKPAIGLADGPANATCRPRVRSAISSIDTYKAQQ